jgi:hypothetical protein
MAGASCYRVALVAAVVEQLIERGLAPFLPTSRFWGWEEWPTAKHVLLVEIGAAMQIGAVISIGSMMVARAVLTARSPLGRTTSCPMVCWTSVAH